MYVLKLAAELPEVWEYVHKTRYIPRLNFKNLDNGAIILIKRENSRIQIAERIRNSVDTFTDPFPAILEIPSKDHPYDPEKDSVLRRVRRLFGE
jgi:ATP synthase F subunit